MAKGSPWVVIPRCLICNKECNLHVTKMKKAGWLDKAELYELGQSMRIVICPEHNIPENYEKAVKIKRERIERIKHEDAFPEWWFEDDDDQEDYNQELPVT